MILPFFFFLQALFMRAERFRGGCVRRSDCGSLKRLVGDGTNALVVSWKILLKASGRASSLWYPPSRSSKLSLIGVRSRYEEILTLNTDWRCLDATIMVLVICWAEVTWPLLLSHMGVLIVECQWTLYELYLNSIGACWSLLKALKMSIFTQ